VEIYLIDVKFMLTFNFGNNFVNHIIMLRSVMVCGTT